MTIPASANVVISNGGYPGPPGPPGAPLTPAAVQSAGFAAAPGQLVPCNTTSGPLTVTLPHMPPDQSVIAVKIIAGTNPVTVAAQGSDAFNQPGGAATLTLKLLNQGVSLQYKASLAVWYVLGDDLPLGQLDLRYLESAGPAVLTDKTSASNVALRSPGANQLIYVTTSGSDSNDGLSWGSAKATIAGALTTLGSSPGTIRLGYGAWTISSADGNGNAVSLLASQKLCGSGRYLSFIVINFAATWGIQVMGPACEVSDITIGCSATGTCTYGVGVQGPTASDFSAEQCTFERLVIDRQRHHDKRFLHLAGFLGTQSGRCGDYLLPRLRAVCHQRLLPRRVRHRSQHLQHVYVWLHCYRRAVRCLLLVN